jgi:uncharacterized protein (DUF302 family)
LVVSFALPRPHPGADSPFTKTYTWRGGQPKAGSIRYQAGRFQLETELARYLHLRWRVTGMNSETAVTTYTISEPFERALKQVREVLARNELSIYSELDVAARIKQELNIGFLQCRILFVDSPCLLLEAATLECAAAVLLPLHVVVAGRGPQTLVHWLNPATIEGARLPMGAAAPLARLQSLVTRSLERIAMRQDVYPAPEYTR